MYVHRHLKTLVAFVLVNLLGFPRRRVGEELGHQDPPGAICKDPTVDVQMVCSSHWVPQSLDGQ